jgi:hypothetical protein
MFETLRKIKGNMAVPKYYYEIPLVILCLIILSELYFQTIFNESVRNPLDNLFIIFVAPGLLLDCYLNLKLSFDNSHHSMIILISGLIYAVVGFVIAAIMQKMRRYYNQKSVLGKGEHLCLRKKQ